MSDGLIPRPLGLQPATATPAGTPTGATGGGSPEFLRLLESLERLTRATPAGGHDGAPKPADTAADQLQTALQRADAEFQTAMDLRRRLEEAFQMRLR